MLLIAELVLLYLPVDGHLAKARKYNMIKLTNGNSINNDSQPEKPALEKIFQNGTMITAIQINKNINCPAPNCIAD
ncbi:MAG: hypothetical protein LJE74_08570 [Proteobacteria bacterium]|nr:hypothetical protein [Pseudomonadota bacterium]